MPRAWMCGASGIYGRRLRARRTHTALYTLAKPDATQHRHHELNFFC